MKKKLEQVLGVLMKAQDYTDKEMQAICDIDAMDSAKELFEELDEAVVIIKSLLKEADNPGNPGTFTRTFVGYQVKTKDDEFVAPYTDKDVFRSIEDAENVIRSQRGIIIDPVEDNNLVIVSRWLENEDEEKRNFVFHGFKKRDFEKDEKVWDDGNYQSIVRNVRRTSIRLS